jgi:hypothetical protein
MTVVVCTLGGHERPFELPRSLVSERADLGGGERTLYELAFAAATAGYDVELRGDISRSMFEGIRVAAGGPAPRVDLSPRRPRRDDVVIVPEAWEVAAYAAPVLSDARVVMMMLSPAGLCGPALRAGWQPPDPVTAPIDSVARPELFQAIAAVGFELWTNSPGSAAAAQGAGVACTFLGTGTPLPFPTPGEKTHDIAIVEANRWRPFAEIVAAQVDATLLRIGPRSGWNVIPEALANARILVWPSRLEGDSRIQREARAVGTVPVALPTQFTACLNEECGAIVVDTLEDMPGAIRRLLDQPEYLEELSRRAMVSVRRQVDWPSYVARVDLAIRRRPPDPPWMFRQLAGTTLDAVWRGHHQETADLRAQAAELRAQTDELRSLVAAATSRATELETQLAAVRAQADELRKLRHRVANRVNDAGRRAPVVHRSVRALVSALARDGTGSANGAVVSRQRRRS